MTINRTSPADEAMTLPDVIRFWLGSFPHKLLVSLIAMAVIILIVLGLPAIWMLRLQTAAGAGLALQYTADGQARALGDFIAGQVGELTTLGKQVSEAAANADAAASADAAFRLLDYQKKFPNNLEVLLTDQHGATITATRPVAANNQSSQAWWQVAYNKGAGKVYIGDPVYDAGSKTFTSAIAIPVFSPGASQASGVLHATVTWQGVFNRFSAQASEKNVTGIDLLLASNQVIRGGKMAGASSAEIAALRAIERPYGEIRLNGAASFVSLAQVSGEAEYLKNLNWQVVAYKYSSDVFAPANLEAAILVVLMLALGGGAIAFAVYFSRRMSAPILDLAETAQKVADGDLYAVARVYEDDEFGVLADAFNSMTLQLREAIRSVEQRAANRTKALVTATEIMRRVSTIQDTRPLLTEVVEQVKASFGYDYAQIYLLDQAGETLTLAAAAGEAGRLMLEKGHAIGLGDEQSTVARCAREKKGVTVNDLNQAPDFLPNQHLQNTRAEMAVPMIAGDSLLGVLDLQSDVAGRFNDADINIQNSLATQVAILLMYARLLEEARGQTQREATLNEIHQKILAATSVDAVPQIAARELGEALGAARTVAQLNTKEKN